MIGLFRKKEPEILISAKRYEQLVEHSLLLDETCGRASEHFGAKEWAAFIKTVRLG